MKRFILLILFLSCSSLLMANMFFAEIDGMQVTVMNINLKKQFSNPIGASSPNLEIDLTSGLTSESIGSISVSEGDIYANELSFDFENVEIPLKAWATDGAGNYYYTRASGGVGTSTDSNSANWSDYNYMSVPKISPDRTDGRVVVQSYFPEPEFISDGSSIVVTGNVDLDYTVLFWDGTPNGYTSDSPFAYYRSLYPDNTKAFAIVVPDVVLAINTTVSKEIYIFGSSLTDVNNTDTTNCKLMSLFFDADGNLYDGAVKKSTGYSSGVTWQRVEAVVRNGNGTYNLSFARNYSEAQGEYIFDVSSDNTFARLTVGASAATTVIGGTTFYYKRLE